MLGWTPQNPLRTNACAQCIFLALGKKSGGITPSLFLQAGAELVQKWRSGAKRRQKCIIFAYYIGYRAKNNLRLCFCKPLGINKKVRNRTGENGAGGGGRTHNLKLGMLALCQLSYARV